MKRYGYKEIMEDKKFYKDNTTNYTLLIQYDLINVRYYLIILNTKNKTYMKLGYLDYRTYGKLNREKIHSKSAEKFGLNTYLKDYELIIE